MAQDASPLRPRVVLIPNTLVSQGMGHLKRCASAAEAVKEVALWFCLDPVLAGGPTFDPEQLQLWVGSLPTLAQWPDSWVAEVAVLDFQRTSPALLAWVARRAKVVVGWDEGGKARLKFPFLVDSLPHQTLPAPNLKHPGLLGYPSGASVPGERFHRPIRRVVVSFGGADPLGLTVTFCRFWSQLADRPAWELTVVRGPLARFELAAVFPVVDNPPDLPRLLREADLVITSWGLTVLESLAAGTPVLLLNPSRYHDGLARAAGLARFGVLQPRAKAFRDALGLAPAASEAACARLLPEPASSSDYWGTFGGTPARCPVCGTTGHAVFARTPHKSFHRCRTCSLEFLSVYQLAPKVYSDAYFFEDYQAQYGKTYLEDFAHISSLGSERLSFVTKKLGIRPGIVFDVGCAFGPFLAAASKEGLRPFGVDIAASAIRHVTQTLGFPAVQASWLDFVWQDAFPGAPQPDLLTMWYVIEHFSDLDSVLRKVSAVLATGGTFAFGTPNGLGMTRRFRGTKFWDESPDDHFSVWNRRSARRILRKYGFDILGFRNTGLHPERFPGIGPGRDWRYHVVAWLGKRLGWGDTFEVYAKKSRELK
ncbi:MAG: methyltransferase domain-containing protein [Spirochaetales bacterium]